MKTVSQNHRSAAMEDLADVKKRRKLFVKSSHKPQMSSAADPSKQHRVAGQPAAGKGSSALSKPNDEKSHRSELSVYSGEFQEQLEVIQSFQTQLSCFDTQMAISEQLFKCTTAPHLPCGSSMWAAMTTKVSELSTALNDLTTAVSSLPCSTGKRTALSSNAPTAVPIDVYRDVFLPFLSVEDAVCLARRTSKNYGTGVVNETFLERRIDNNLQQHELVGTVDVDRQYGTQGDGGGGSLTRFEYFGKVAYVVEQGEGEWAKMGQLLRLADNHGMIDRNAQDTDDVNEEELIRRAGVAVDHLELPRDFFDALFGDLSPNETSAPQPAQTLPVIITPNWISSKLPTKASFLRVQLSSRTVRHLPLTLAIHRTVGYYIIGCSLDLNPDPWGLGWRVPRAFRNEVVYEMGHSRFCIVREDQLPPKHRFRLHYEKSDPVIRRWDRYVDWDEMEYNGESLPDDVMHIVSSYSSAAIRTILPTSPRYVCDVHVGARDDDYRSLFTSSTVDGCVVGEWRDEVGGDGAEQHVVVLCGHRQGESNAAHLHLSDGRVALYTTEEAVQGASGFDSCYPVTAPSVRRVLSRFGGLAKQMVDRIEESLAEGK
ncbi:unnamed protein product [Vitrella brassicaformis CCMP3155]|uniref:Uncharacterized protein n=1 Tax=Vitrella brassicaformis (strain CCMP3155) TaxID=1169540 RepID=A0A0G4EYP3_VITBC|nr:unnamed protein product [Vitrella brassicaformis CCMP3155]|eukprot:CEM03575.1 unnamed protein product [Vitrella brassicaformis CCMP3155]